MSVQNLTFSTFNISSATTAADYPVILNTTIEQPVRYVPTLFNTEFHNHTSFADKRVSNSSTRSTLLETDSAQSQTESFRNITNKELTTVGFLNKLQTPINDSEYNLLDERRLKKERDEKLERHLLLTVLMISAYAFAVISALVVVMCKERRSGSGHALDGVTHYYSSVTSRLNQMTAFYDRKHRTPLRRSRSDTCLLRAEYNSCQLEDIC